MNGLDLVILAAIGLGALFGAGRGILRIVSSLIALVAAFYFAALYYQAVGGYLARAFSMRPGSGATLGYIVIFLAVMIVVGMGRRQARPVDPRRAHDLGRPARRRGGRCRARRVTGRLGRSGCDSDVAGRYAHDPCTRSLRHACCDYSHDLAGFVPGQIRDAYYYRESQLITYWNRHGTASPGPSSGPATTP